MDDSFAAEVSPLHTAAPEILSRLRRDADDTTELFAERTYREQVTLRYDRWRGYGEPREEYRTDLVEGTGLRLLNDDVSRYGYVEGYAPVMVRNKADEVRGGPPAAGAVLDRAPPRGSLELPEDVTDRVTLEEKRGLLQAAVDAAFSLEPRLRDLEVAFQGSTRRTYVVSSEDRPTFAATSLIGMRVRARIERAQRTVDGHAIGGGTGGVGQFLMTTPESISQRCVERLQAALAARPLQTVMGDVPVVIEGGWGGVWLHEAVGHLLEADTIGPYSADRIGERVASEDVTIIDDGTYERGRGTALFDDEGFPMERTVLIENGVLRSLMTDRRQAARLGLPRTGNGRREGYRSEPAVRMTNLFLAGGRAAPDALLADVKKGVYVRTVGRGRVYPQDDRFSFHVVEGYLIEAGRRTRPVTNMNISGRPSKMLESIVGISDEVRVDPARGVCRKADQTVPVSVGTPTVLVNTLTVRALEAS